MAEVLGISASIAGLISLADITFKYVYKYVRAAKDAKTDIHSLADEVNGLATLLRISLLGPMQANTESTSHDHFNIRMRLDEDFEIVPIAAHTEDVRLYVRAEIARRIQSRQLELSEMVMKEEILDALVGRAEGMFRWVVCQLDYLCDCAHDGERREALKKLPPGLPESYRRLLERVDKCSPKVQDIRQAVSTPETLGATLGKSNTVSEQEILRRCSSLIRKSVDGMHFEFAHFSVTEFLEDEVALSQPLSTPGLDKYLISEANSRSLLAAQCLQFLQLKNFERQVSDSEEWDLVLKRNEEYPFYQLAALWWFDEQ
ncbi:hypothetical protein QQZ08_000285 [Neonectria magnoliae]|uniref:Fungal N-terminal domain-containing protein n=1 Tax=Neonectria magnoliae TaxID=2732573 RepID=A0ABR1II75_9HYPO